MKKLNRFILLILSLLFFVSGTNLVAYADEDKIYLGGMPAGFFMESRGAFVAGLCDVITENGLKSPSKDSGVLSGDVILEIDGREVNNAYDVEKNLKSESKIELTIERNGKSEKISVRPAKDINGKLKLGVFIREGINGIGTITYIKNGTFASLGHPVLNEDGNVLKIIKGSVYDCSITGYVKGERGKPGELRGIFTRKNEKGKIEKNCEFGVFGKIKKNAFKGLTEIVTGEAKPGNAEIYSTINGKEPQNYAISIIKCDDLNSIKNYVIKITDERLLDSTGGIVQGMSGSPIVQGGKLVGAVTHVFINDPSRGFGISIENMLKNQ